MWCGIFVSLISFSNVGWAMTVSSEKRGSPRGIVEQGKRHLFQGNRGTKLMPNFEENRGIKIILGNREHKKKIIFWGNRGTSQFISGEQGNSYIPGRASEKVPTSLKDSIITQ